VKTKWLHIIGGLIALSSISIGLKTRDPFMSFSIAVSIMLWWDAKDSPKREFLRRLSTSEMEGLQRGVEKGVRIKELVIIALIIPAVLMLNMHLAASLFLFIVIGGMILSAIASEVELEAMERLEREKTGVVVLEVKYTASIKRFLLAFGREFLSLFRRERKMSKCLVRFALLIHSFIDISIFRKGRSRIADYIDL